MSPRLNKGFTLIELMIVITIIGVMAGIIGLSVNTGDPAKEAHKEAKRFIAVMTMALDEAAFNQQDLGIHIQDEGYDFLYWGLAAPGENESSLESAEEVEEETQDTIETNSDQNNKNAPKPSWQLVTNEPSLERYEIPEDIRLEIEIEDSELLRTSDLEESELTKTNLNLDEIGPKVEEEETIEPPHVYILSSGELAPSFRLGFYHVDKPDAVFFVVGDEMGRVDFERDEFDDE